MHISCSVNADELNKVIPLILSVSYALELEETREEPEKG